MPRAIRLRVTPKLLDRVRLAVRARHFSRRTEKAYVAWVRRYVLFTCMRHPDILGEQEVLSFLMHLARDRRVSASTQNQALAALLFLYRDVHGRPSDWGATLIRASRPTRLPLVLSPAEVTSVLVHVPANARLVCDLLYGRGSGCWRR